MNRILSFYRPYVCSPTDDRVTSSPFPEDVRAAAVNTGPKRTFHSSHTDLPRSAVLVALPQRLAYCL